MVRFSETELVVVGRTVAEHDGAFYMRETHRDLLEGMAREFGSATYLCQATRGTRATPTDRARIDEDYIAIRPNWSWKTASAPRKIASLRDEVRYLAGRDGEVTTYTYYPGFYTFFLAPFAMRYGDVSLSHFGSSAVDSAEAAYDDSLAGTAKRLFFARAQRYVIDRSDVTLSTGPGMAANHPEVVLSRPLLKFDEAVPRDPDEICRSEPIELLFVGAFRPVKGHETLVRSFARLRERSERSYRLTLVGNGRLKAETEALVERLDVADAVEFTGYIADVEMLKDEYRSSDVFVLPSLKEAVPWVLYEASMMGIPLVSTDVGGIGSFFEDERHALLVPPGESEPMCRAIERVVEDVQLRNTLVENAQSKVADHVGGDPIEQRLDLIAAARDD